MVIDFHCHILPGADHGSDGDQTTAGQLKILGAAGIELAVATPHFYPDRHCVSDFIKMRSETAGRLYALLGKDSPGICLGAEVLVCPGMENMEGLSLLTIQGTRVILLEMPSAYWSDKLYETVLAIRDSGLIPVLAHIDRYPFEKIYPLLQKGIGAQLNADSLTRPWSRRRYMALAQEGGVVALGSDLHGQRPKKYRDFTKAIKKYPELCGYIFDQSRELLKNATVLSKTGQKIPN